ncbi:MAG: YraN family protein [Chloroflexi bacterium]|nr:YraN family protein [Chloroflexota bacterium]
MPAPRRPETRRRRLGQRGEEIAVTHLAQLGYTIEERNHRRPEGEIDIIARQGAWRVFVEVRTRLAGGWTPEESVTLKKREKLIQLAQLVQEERGDLNDPWRIDVIAVELSPTGVSQRVTHIEHAIEQ